MTFPAANDPLDRELQRYGFETEHRTPLQAKTQRFFSTLSMLAITASLIAVYVLLCKRLSAHFSNSAVRAFYEGKKLGPYESHDKSNWAVTVAPICFLPFMISTSWLCLVKRIYWVKKTNSSSCEMHAALLAMALACSTAGLSASTFMGDTSSSTYNNTLFNCQEHGECELNESTINPGHFWLIFSASYFTIPIVLSFFFGILSTLTIFCANKLGLETRGEQQRLLSPTIEANHL